MGREADRPSERDASARRMLSELIVGYQVSAAIGVFARLGIADVLAAGPATGAELASAVDAHEDALTRLMDATLNVGLFSLGPDGRYSLTDLGTLLRADVPGSLRRYAVVSTDPWRWDAYGRLTHAAQTGESGFVEAHGCRLWDYLATHPEAAASFEESLARIAVARDKAVVSAVDLGGSRVLVDVGGGRGALLAALLAQNPHLRAVLFDLPAAVEGARSHLAEAGMLGRCEVVAGDFRAAVPAGGDVYLLSWILHDWDDQSALGILSNCRAAMEEGARLLVVEMVVPEADDPTAAAFERLIRQADLEMLAVVGGRERKAGEFRELFARSGFIGPEVTSLEGLPWSVLAGKAV